MIRLLCYWESAPYHDRAAVRAQAEHLLAAVDFSPASEVSAQIKALTRAYEIISRDLSSIDAKTSATTRVLSGLIVFVGILGLGQGEIYASDIDQIELLFFKISILLFIISAIASMSVLYFYTFPFEQWAVDRNVEHFHEMIRLRNGRIRRYRLGYLIGFGGSVIMTAALAILFLG